MNKLKELGYPVKLYLYIVLFIATVIGMKFVVEIQLPSGGRSPYLFLIWNTFLAWIPVGLVIVLDLVSLLKNKLSRRVLFLVVGLLWLFFYPNAAYMITDMLHPFARYPVSGYRFWQEISFWDHLLTLFFVALLGLALGNASLASVHHLVRRSYGSVVGWVFAIAVLGLSSFGVYLGRFNRWNSWDIIKRPFHVLEEMVIYFSDIEHLRHTMAFCKWIFIITLFSYVILNLFGAMKNSKGTEVKE